VAAIADSVQMLEICQDVTIGEGDSQLIKPPELYLGKILKSSLVYHLSR